MGRDNQKFTWILVLAATGKLQNENRILSFFDPLKSRIVNLWLAEGRHIHRFMLDKGGEFDSQVFVKMLQEQGVMQTNSHSYQPQSNRLAERCVGLMKSSCRRLPFSAHMAKSMWPYAVQLSAQIQQASVLGYEWNLPVFGELVAVWEMKPKDENHSLDTCGALGRLKPKPLDQNVCPLHHQWNKFLGTHSLRSKVFTSPYRSLVLPDGQDAWCRVDDGFLSRAPLLMNVFHSMVKMRDGTWEEKVNEYDALDTFENTEDPYLEIPPLSDYLDDGVPVRKSVRFSEELEDSLPVKDRRGVPYTNRERNTAGRPAPEQESDAPP
eukprot:803392-Amphidinium_carterae.1